MFGELPEELQDLIIEYLSVDKFREAKDLYDSSMHNQPLQAEAS